MSSTVPADNTADNSSNNPVVTFLTSRRSVTAKTMAPGQVSRADLDAILTAGLRVPDHGALKPWKLVVLQGDVRKTLDEEVILAEFMRENPDAEDKFIEIETNRLQRAHTVIAVLSSPVEHPKIVEWEMALSAGAVCTTLLYAAQSMGYAAQWLTEWYAYNNAMLARLGGVAGHDRIAGFIYIGEKVKDPMERTRPDLDEVVTFL
ncbi:nitroreductase family protein [Candidatus Puniceispirillum marinum]|uniref:Putative NAD(P)H nitroreductase n=1 Tax=Puniceispirillum marinum (strain IMCC1322) TaxID=488538 RepID=D5BQN2_PUNMI|nr:nitroreductase [Candidatus Puniceispirillum marinum]ADE40750.1 conserved hypothetical protein [Candidatus Puniceispirillum marinum IMCC1322]